MGRSNRILLIAVAASLAIHLAALFGTPRFELGWVEDAEPAAPLEATIVALEPPPAKTAPAPPARRPKSRPTPPAALPVEPAEFPSNSLLEAPSPDGDAAPDAPELAESPAPEAPAEVAGSPGPEPIAETPAAAEYPLRRARLVYDLFYLTSLEANNPTKFGQVTHRWSQDGRTYEVESVGEAVGFLWLVFNGKFVQRSTGAIRADGLHPAQYTLDRGRGGRAEVARFDWPEGKLALAWKDQSLTLALPAAAQDPLSLMHQLYFLRQVPASGPLAVATSRKLYRSSFALVGGETLATPLGEVRTLHFRQQEPNGVATELWADLDRSLLPARVRVTDKKGNVIDQVVREVELEPVESAASAPLNRPPD
jgi:hypothetical protein